LDEKRPESAPGKSLDAMSTASLQQLLELELETDQDVNVELVKEVISVLDARTESEPIDVDAAYQDFLENYLYAPMLYPPEDDAPAKPSEQKHRKKPIVRIASLVAILAVVLLGATVSASAAGYDLWGAVAEWTSETFKITFGRVEYPNSSAESTVLEDNELSQALKDDGIVTPLVPLYIPEGYVLQDLQADPGRYIAVYENEKNTIAIHIRGANNGNGVQLQKVDTSPEIYSVNGIDHYIMPNENLFNVAWVNGSFQCTILGIPSVEEAHKMIDSIYMEDFQ
jgi:hypothetical protein